MAVDAFATEIGIMVICTIAVTVLIIMEWHHIIVQSIRLVTVVITSFSCIMQIADFRLFNIHLFLVVMTSFLYIMQIADFGLSRHASATTVDTETYGTVTHMPPELLMDGKLTKSADVYAFGVLLWEMYTGRVDSILLLMLLMCAVLR